MPMTQKIFSFNSNLAENIFSRFSKEIKELELRDVKEYSTITRNHLTAFIESGFWASQIPEEGRFHPLRISLAPPGESSSDCVFSSKIPYTPEKISKLGPVLSMNHKSIGVWHSSNEALEIWGISDQPSFLIQLTANIPGHIVFSTSSIGFRVAISHSLWGFIDPMQFSTAWRIPGAKRSDPLDDPDAYKKMHHQEWAYMSVAQSMLEHRHGGTLIIVPEDDHKWRGSLTSIQYETKEFTAIKENFDAWQGLAAKKSFRDLLFPDAQSIQVKKQALEGLRFLGQLTAVDGAVVIGRDLKVFGFGTKLQVVKPQPVKPNERLSEIQQISPVEGRSPKTVQLADLGGMRHQSAAQFVYDQKNCTAIVCSQDGYLSAFNWDDDDQDKRVRQVINLEYAL